MKFSGRGRRSTRDFGRIEAIQAATNTAGVFGQSTENKWIA